MQQFLSAVSVLAPSLQEPLRQVEDFVRKKTFELRLRARAPVVLFGAYGCLVLQRDGTCAKTPTPQSVQVSLSQLRESFQRICAFSVHTHQQDLVRGFVTAADGHRVGVCATAVQNEAGQVVSVREVSSLNLRIARHIPQCAAPLLPLLQNGQAGLLLAGPPGSGKTTMLRDLACLLTDFTRGYYKVCVADARQEILPMRDGVPQEGIGQNCDVLSGYPLSQAIEIAVRAMSPAFILCDELVTPAELAAVRRGVNTGVRFVATVHAADETDLLSRELIISLLESRAFDTVVLLRAQGMPCTIDTVFDAKELLDEHDARRLGLVL